MFRLRIRPGVGREQAGVRYGVVVQADALSPLSTVLVSPTSRSARAATFRPEVEIAGTTTRVLVEQTCAVDPSRLGELAGMLAPDEMWGVDLALALVLDLEA